ncbi:MAG: STAS domain-containing protein [Rhodoferax sp.]|nr:STAS domain-containing protein [Rhodoferax sp.]MCF8208196.1 STAS domain-containing protein [Rhodoferax sp.]
MATKDDRPTLLSKVAMFVRNPTKDWAELERSEPEQEGGYDKQALKAMIERKRQNDFVRKREFDQLRKLRNLSRDGDAQGVLARPSVFQSSYATDPDGRAVTLKKIDDIEAQMSKQWWKGKQAASGGPASGLAVARSPGPEAPPTVLQDASTVAPPLAFEPTVQAEMNFPVAKAAVEEFAPTEMGGGVDYRAPPLPTPQARNPSMQAINPVIGVLAQSYDGSDAGFSASKLFAIEVEDLATDPELEEAAIRFANGDDAGAETGLLAALRADAALPEAGLSWAAALLDLYRATDNRSKFDLAVTEFGRFFDRLEPLWGTIGAEDARPDQSPGAEPVGSPGSVENQHSKTPIWGCPPELNMLAMEQLREVLSSHPTPWLLDWSRLTHIAPDAMDLMAGLFDSLCAEDVSLRFSGAEHLVQTLRSMMPSGNRSIGVAWWAVRLNALRAMHLQDEFELAALDYCVTFEVAPPPWTPPRCEYRDVPLLNNHSNAAPPSVWGAEQSALATTIMGSANLGPVQLELKGQVLGDATHALSGADPVNHRNGRVTVNCGHLVRVDFSAAGSILNWVATRQSEGCQVQFREVHRLVAAFFNVIGINEHARVLPRPI